MDVVGVSCAASIPARFAFESEWARALVSLLLAALCANGGWVAAVMLWFAQ